MFCKNCGKSILENSTFCQNCGSKQDLENKNLNNNPSLKMNDGKINSFFIKNKWFVIFYSIWAFQNLICYFAGNDDAGFWPITDEYHMIDAYGFLELFVYLMLPLLILIIIKLGGKEIKNFFKNHS